MLRAPPGSSRFYGLWASSVGAFCFQLFAHRFPTWLRVTADPGACSATVTLESTERPIHEASCPRSAWASPGALRGFALSGALHALARVRAFSRRAGTELPPRGAVTPTSLSLRRGITRRCDGIGRPTSWRGTWAGRGRVGAMRAAAQIGRPPAGPGAHYSRRLEFIDSFLTVRVVFALPANGRAPGPQLLTCAGHRLAAVLLASHSA
jgi:hypothetical protein